MNDDELYEAALNNATNPIRKFAKTKHVTCSNKRICNKFGYTPSIACLITHCQYANVKEFEIEITPKGFARKVTRFNMVDF